MNVSRSLPMSQKQEQSVALTDSKYMQRWLALGLLLAGILIFSMLVIAPVIGKGLELHETKNALIFRLQQYDRILARKDAVIASMAQIKSQHQEQGYFNNQSTGALASADLQKFIKQTIVEAGGQLTSTQALPVSNKDKFSRITVRVRMTGNSEVLRSVLYKIETSKPLIIIDQIDIRPMRGTRNRKTRQIDPSNELNVNFQAVSFMRMQPE